MPDSSPEAGATPETEDSAVTSATETTQDSSEAASSTAGTAGTMLDAVQAALKPKEASPSSTTPDLADEANPNAQSADQEAPDDELSGDELKALSWKAQQRFKKLSSNLKAKDTELGALKPKIEAFDRLSALVRDAGIDEREHRELVEVGGLLKSNPSAARERLIPVLRALDELLGEVLPADLQERVRLGYITESDARELNRSRATANLATQRADRTAAEAKARDDEAAVQRTVNASIDAIERWEKAKAVDPDWHLKRKEVAEQVELAITREANKRREPYFPTADESVKLAEAALKTINDRLKRFGPRPTEIRSGHPAGASTRSKPVAKTMLEAINNAL